MKQGILFLRRMGYPAQKMMKKDKEIRLFAVIFAVFITSIMLFAITAHAATVTTKNMPSKSVCVGSSKTLAKPNVSGFKWKTVNNTYYTLTTAGKLTGKKVGTASFSVTCKNVKYVYKVTVKNRPKLNCTSKTIMVTEKLNLKVLNVGNSRVIWTYKNPKVVYDGVGYGPGTTIATAKCEGVTMTCKVTVKDYNGSLAKKMAPKANANVLSAFDELGFKIEYDPTADYGGRFNAHDRTITLRFVGDDTIYHEMGHFLAFVAGNVDRTSDFAAIYNSEKSKFTGINRSYATQNASEYFAESYHDYILQLTETKKKLPKTCSAISDAVKKVTPARIARVKEIYGPFWK